MNNLTETLREHGVLVLFGFIIAISLFLGDGKQPAVDLFVAGGITLLWAIVFYQKQKIRSLPTVVQFLWVAVFATHAVSSALSDSMGYSITATMRMIEVFLVYRLFYTLSPKNTLKAFYLCVLGVITLATTASFVYIFVPRLETGLPSMNLLYATYGHNQLAGLLLFGIPMVVAGDPPIPPWCRKALLILFLSGVVFSFARGAWILLAVCVVFLLITKRLAGKFNKSMVIVFIGATAGLMVVMSLLSPRFIHTPSTPKNAWFYKQTIKPSIYENRVKYWLQALRAIQERPTFGSGPGTFYLQSKRLQEAQSSYSWFAHSFPLETLVEIGILGAIPMSFLIFHHGKKITRGLKSGNNMLSARYGVPLALGASLTLIYSTYEYSMNFLVIWLLFWATLGLLLGVVIKPGVSRAVGRPWVISVCLFIVVSYYISSVTSQLFSKRAEPAFFIAPYDKDQALRLLDEIVKDVRKPTNHEMIYLNIFHKNNPEVMFAIAKTLRYADAQLSYEYFRKATIADPRNSEYMREYFDSLLSVKNPSAVGEEILLTSAASLQRKYDKQIFELKPYAQGLGEYYVHWMARENPTFKNGYAGLFYRFGISDLRDVEPMEKLLILARDIYPDLGHLHVELAAYYFYIKKDKEKSKEVLIECQSVPSAAKQCTDQLTNKLYYPSEYKNVIW